MDRFIVGIPTYNRADLLMPVLKKYASLFEKTIIVDNGDQNIRLDYERVDVCNPGFNLGVAASWNYLCNRAFEIHKKEWVLLINDDVELGYGSNVVHEAIDRCESGLAQSEYMFSVILLSKSLYEKVGPFDGGFYPAYYEDSDYLYRMKLLGIRQDVDPALNPKVFRQSQTYEKAPQMVNDAMRNNKERYILKWGGLPLLEQFKKPYEGRKFLIDIIK